MKNTVRTELVEVHFAGAMAALRQAQGERSFVYEF